MENKRELLKRNHFDKMCPGVDASLKADLMTEQQKRVKTARGGSV